MSGLTKGYLSKIERGAGQPSIGTVFRIAEALGVPAGQLLTADGEGRAVVADVARASAGAPPRCAELLLRPLFTEGTGRLIAMEMWPPLEVRPAAEASAHAGAELLHVVSGRLEVVFEDETLILEQGGLPALRRQTPAPDALPGPSARPRPPASVTGGLAQAGTGARGRPWTRIVSDGWAAPLRFPLRTRERS